MEFEVHIKCYLFVVVAVRDVTASRVQVSYGIQSQGLFFTCALDMFTHSASLIIPKRKLQFQEYQISRAIE